MSAIVKPATSLLIPGQAPHFVSETYPGLVSFLQAYYSWLDTVAPRNLENDQDIDASVSAFVSHYNAELNYIAATFTGLTTQQFLEHAKAFYASKGSVASYELLFQLMFGETVQLQTPGDQIFKLSAANWMQQSSIFVEITAGDPFSLIGTDAAVIYNRVSYPVQIASVTVASGNVYQLYLDSGYRIPSGALGATFTDNFSVSGAVTGVIDPTISPTSTTIFSAGSGFSAGQIYTIQPPTGTDSTILINSVDSNGGIIDFQVIKYGIAPSKPFTIILNPDVQTVQSTTYNPYQDTLGNFSESGFIYLSDYWVIDPTNLANQYGSADYSGAVESSFTSQASSSNNNSNAGAAIITFGVSAFATYPGVSETNVGFLSDPSSVLQDSFFYQQFSYLLKSSHQLSEFAQQVKSYLHPVGTKMFAQYNINTTTNLKTSATLTQNP